MATRNQMSLVVLKLQLLEDELGKLYQGVEKYCSEVINKGAESIRSRVKQEEAIDEFRLAYDTALNFMKKKITEMERFTKIPDVTQQTKKNGGSETPMFKVITNLQTLRCLKQQFQQMITNLLSEMLQLGNRFLTQQSPLNPSQLAHLNTRRASQTIPRSKVEFSNDIATTGIGARRASIDTTSHANSKPNLDKRRASYDVHRQNPDLQKWKPDLRGAGNDVKKAIPEITTVPQDQKSDTARQNRDIQRLVFEHPSKSFADVSRQLEICLVFVMEKRLEFGETERNEFSDLLALLGGDKLNRMTPYKQHLPLSMVTRQDQSVDKLIERIELLERQANDNSSDLICLDAALDPLITDVSEVKAKCEGLEHVVTLQYGAVAHLNETVTSMNHDLVDLEKRFESFLRIFAASRSETTKQYVRFERRMSDVEKTKDGLGKFSDGERINQGAAPHHGEKSIDEVDFPEVFEAESKKNLVFKDGESEKQMGVAADQDKELRNLRTRGDAFLTSRKQDLLKNGTEVEVQIKEMKSKLLAMQKSKPDLVQETATSCTPCTGPYGIMCVRMVSSRNCSEDNTCESTSLV